MALETIGISLAELVQQLGPGDEVILTRDQRPVAKLVGTTPTEQRSRRPGSCRGMITLLEEDDEHLAGFAEYR